VLLKHLSPPHITRWSTALLHMLQVTISDQAGETLKTVNFRGEPLELCVASCKDDGKGPAGARKPVSSSCQ
jgi:hypothetical protein